jgi:hypothetical protein
MTTSTKVQKSSLVMTISIRFCVWQGEKVGNLFLYVSFTFQHDSYNGISKRMVGCSVFIFTQTM